MVFSIHEEQLSVIKYMTIYIEGTCYLTRRTDKYGFPYAGFITLDSWKKVEYFAADYHIIDDKICISNFNEDRSDFYDMSGEYLSSYLLINEFIPSVAFDGYEDEVICWTGTNYKEVYDLYININTGFILKVQQMREFSITVMEVFSFITEKLMKWLSIMMMEYYLVAGTYRMH